MNVMPLSKDQIKGRVSISVNGRPVQEYLGEEESKGIGNFYYSELRGMRGVSHRHVSTAKPMRNVSRAKEVGNGSIRCE
jgi:hypothetical protein